MRLLSEAQSGDLLLVEAIDRLSRLEHSAWVELKIRSTERVNHRINGFTNELADGRDGRQ